jgi:flagellar hook-associated protein 2
MGTITSGVGLISGLNIDDIVTKLMAIEKIPLTQLQSRIKTVDSTRAAFGDLSARVLAIKAAFAPLKGDLLFKSNKADSSNTDFIQATATSAAAAGTQRIRVEQIASTQQLVSRGFSDPDRSPLGAGTVVVASALSKLGQQTALDMLNGQQGVSQGTIQITDGSGASAKVDLSGAKTVNDVVSAINAASGIQVRAEVRGDRLAIVDQSGQTTGTLTVADVSGGHAASDLGIAGTGTQGKILGRDINTIGEGTSLSLLNDGNGLGIDGVGDDLTLTIANGDTSKKTFNVSLADRFTPDTNLATLNNGQGVRLGTVRVTHADGSINDVDLSNAKTINDVMTGLGAAKVTVMGMGNKFQITDTTAGAGSMTIEDVDGHTASDLGIVGTATGSDATKPPTLRGTEIYHVRTVGDVLRAINFATGNDGAITASLDAAGKGLVLTDTTGGAGQISVKAVGTSGAAADLGLTGPSVDGVLSGERLISTMNSTLLRSLNGGQGIRQLGQVKITDRAGAESTFDFTGAHTVDDVLSILQGGGTGGAKITAQLAESGLGIVLQDTSLGTGTLSVADVTGTTAADLKLSGTATGDTLRSGALYRQSVSGNTLLSDMNFGKGVSAGAIKITDSSGNSTVLNITSPSTTHLRDVISLINNSDDNVNVQARINDSGDGIVVIDKAGGPGHLTIADTGSSTAGDLGLAGTTASGQDRLDGRISQEITIGGGDSLNDFAGQLGKASKMLSVGVINDGSSVTPYRLMITAANSGSRGALTIDAGAVSLGLDTLVQAQDSVAYIGGNGTTGGVRVVSSDTQLRNVIPGVTLNLAGKTGGYSDVTVGRNTDSLTKQLGSIADKLNDVFTQLDTLTQYNDDATKRGILLGDSTAIQLQQNLESMLSARVSVNGQSLSLSDLGFSVGSDGVKFDETAFHAKYDANPDGILKVFTDTKNGLWTKMDGVLNNLTDPTWGLLPSQSQNLQSQEDLFNQRATDLQALLDGKQARLYAQYQAMETALSQLQGQQAALGSLTAAVTSMNSSSSSSK